MTTRRLIESAGLTITSDAVETADEDGKAISNESSTPFLGLAMAALALVALTGCAGFTSTDKPSTAADAWAGAERLTLVLAAVR